MALEIVLVAVLPALFAAAAVWDLTTFTIPNTLNALVALLFLLFLAMAWFTGPAMSWSDAGWHAAAGLAGLGIGFALFAAGWIGGGDAKLFAVSALWLGWSALPEYALLASVFGGVLTLGVLALRKLPLPGGFARQNWLLRLSDAKAGIPYGVALASAALVVLPHTELFRFAVAA